MQVYATIFTNLEIHKTDVITNTIHALHVDAPLSNVFNFRDQNAGYFDHERECGSLDMADGPPAGFGERNVIHVHGMFVSGSRAVVVFYEPPSIPVLV